MKRLNTTRAIKTRNPMQMTDQELEGWFRAAGLPAEVVDNCADAHCPDCKTVEAAQAA